MVTLDELKIPRAARPYADQVVAVTDALFLELPDKAQLIRDILNLRHLDTKFSRRELIERSPLTWMLQVDGLIVDARQLPVVLQVKAS